MIHSILILGISEGLNSIIQLGILIILDASASGQSNGFESDNEGTSPYNANPRTKVRVSNFTEVGLYMILQQQ